MVQAGQISFQGVLIKVRSSPEESARLRGLLERDFRGLMGESSFSLTAPKLLIDVHPRAKTPAGFFVPIFRFRGAWILAGPKGRRIRYAEGLICDLRIRRARTGRISFYGDDLEFVAGKLYLFILAFFGEAMERRGWSRMHAAGWTRPVARSAGTRDLPGAVLLMARSGTGKSTIASRLIKELGRPILGDEVVFLKDGEVIALPVSIKMRGVDPFGKIRIPLAAAELAQSGRLLRVWWSLPGEPGLGRLTTMDRIRFLRDLSLGIHLPQIAEFLVRKENIPFLARVFQRRLRLGFSLLREEKVGKLLISEGDLASKAQDFQKFVESLENIDGFRS